MFFSYLRMDNLIYKSQIYICFFISVNFYDALIEKIQKSSKDIIDSISLICVFMLIPITSPKYAISINKIAIS